MDYIPDDIYRRIVDYMPICCVDLLIHDGPAVLLLLRANRPALDQWWFPGGRLHKGEHFNQAADRIAKQELHLHIVQEGLVGVYEQSFPDSRYEGIATHTVTIVIKAHLPPNATPKLDDQHTQWAWFSATPRSSYIAQAIRDTGILAKEDTQ